MKKTATIIIISLVMCLTMAFPASAARTFTDNIGLLSALEQIDVRAKSLLPSDYKYRLVFSVSSVSSSATPALSHIRVIYTNTTTFGLNSRYFYASPSSASTSFTGATPSGFATVTMTPTSSNQYDGNLAYITTYPALGSIYGVFTNLSTCTISSWATHKANTLSRGNDIDWSIVSQINTTALQTLITQAKAKQNIGYTQESWNALQTQITAAETVMANASKTQTQVDNAKNALQAALNGLVLLPDNSSLSALIIEAELIEDIGYKKSSWNTFQLSLSSAKNVFLDSNSTQSQIDNAKSSLQDSINNLKLLPDSTILQALIEHVQSLSEDAYTSLSWQVLNNKLIQALIMLEDKDYVDSQIDNMISGLESAITGLVVVTSPDPPIVKPPITDPPVVIVEGSKFYSLGKEAEKYTDITDGVKSDHLEPIKQAVVENIEVTRKFGLWAYIITLLPLITVIIIINFVRRGDDAYRNIDMSSPQISGRSLGGRSDKKFFK